MPLLPMEIPPLVSPGWCCPAFIEYYYTYPQFLTPLEKLQTNLVAAFQTDKFWALRELTDHYISYSSGRRALEQLRTPITNLREQHREETEGDQKKEQLGKKAELKTLVLFTA